MKTIYFTLAFLIFLSCSDNNIDKENPILKNQVIVNEDSCLKWKLPPVSFTLTFPENYGLTYNSQEQIDNYLRLKKYADNGVIIQEISIGKAGHYNEDQIKKWIYKSDSLLMNFRTHQAKYIGYKTVGDKKRFVLQGTINFDLVGRPDYKGDYKTLLVFEPSTKKLNGISFSVITKADADSSLNEKEVNKILNSLTFMK